MKPADNKPGRYSDAEKRKLESKGFRHSLRWGYINTRDPWWLYAWVLFFLAIVAGLILWWLADS